MTTITNDIKNLESLFSKLNERFFDNQLEVPVITVSPDVHGTWGWFTTWRAWKTENNQKGYYEINICSDYLNRPIYKTAGTLLHEMVHLYNKINDIQDCSRGGKYHNKHFKDSAEAHGLIVEKTEKYGYSSTKLSSEAKQYLDSINISTPKFYRDSPKKLKKESKKSSTRKYICPCCNTIIRSTKDVYVICGICNTEFKKQE